MLQILSLLCLMLIAPPVSTDEGETDWLTSSHPRILMKVGQTVEPRCVVDCTRYSFIMSYHGSNSVSSEELIEWQAVSQTGCMDIVLPGKTTFVCKLASSFTGTGKNGQHNAILRYRLQPEQVVSVTSPAALLRLRDVTFRLSSAGRATLVEFLRAAVPVSD
jgi:hypothetical protein